MSQFTESQQRVIDRAVEEWGGRPAYARGYPQQRQRPPAIAEAQPAGSSLTSAALAQPTIDLTVQGGAQINFASVINANSTAGFVTGVVIPRRFIISHITWVADRPSSDLSQLLIKIADDRDVSAGISTTGIALGVESAAQTFLIFHTGVQEIFPMFRVENANKFIKAIVVNKSAASALNVQMAISLLYF